jgi:hypothetical protein
LRYELLLVLFQFVLALQLFFERFGDFCQLSRLHVGFELLQVVGNCGLITMRVSLPFNPVS